MNVHRVMKRTWVIYVFLLVLLAGIAFFLWEYATQSPRWVAATGSPHLYNNSNIGCGTITDRSGTILLDISSSRSYAEEVLTRKSTLHWLGDRKGFINASAVSNYADEMAGYDKINGVYAASGEAGHAQLTLSARVQNTALEALGNRKGTVAVYNYKTGEILCAVTSPTFDPDDVPDIAQDDTGACRYFLQYITGKEKCQPFSAEKEKGKIYAIYLCRYGPTANTGLLPSLLSKTPP